MWVEGVFPLQLQMMKMGARAHRYPTTSQIQGAGTGGQKDYSAFGDRQTRSRNGEKEKAREATYSGG